MFLASLLTSGSSFHRAFPESFFQWLLRLQSPVTAAGLSPVHTGFLFKRHVVAPETSAFIPLGPNNVNSYFREMPLSWAAWAA